PKIPGESWCRTSLSGRGLRGKVRAPPVRVAIGGRACGDPAPEEPDAGPRAARWPLGPAARDEGGGPGCRGLARRRQSAPAIEAALNEPPPLPMMRARPAEATTPPITAAAPLMMLAASLSWPARAGSMCTPWGGGGDGHAASPLRGAAA